MFGYYYSVFYFFGAPVSTSDKTEPYLSGIQGHSTSVWCYKAINHTVYIIALSLTNIKYCIFLLWYITNQLPSTLTMMIHNMVWTSHKTGGDHIFLKLTTVLSLSSKLTISIELKIKKRQWIKSRNLSEMEKELLDLVDNETHTHILYLNYKWYSYQGGMWGREMQSLDIWHLICNHNITV